MADRYTAQSDQFGLYQVAVPWVGAPYASLSVEASGYQAKSGIAVGAGLTAAPGARAGAVLTVVNTPAPSELVGWLKGAPLWVV